jgi:tetratricopeptide (TPR) repeat protein
MGGDSSPIVRQPDRDVSERMILEQVQAFRKKRTFPETLRNSTVDRPRPKWRPESAVWGLAICLLVVTFLAYRDILSFDFVNYDDLAYVSSNARVQAGLTVENVKWAFTTTYYSNWHPLVWLSYMFDCELFGPNPGAIHAVNLVFHLANTLLVFLILRKVTGQTIASFIVAALFGLHPLRCESVTWISERKDVLSSFWGLLALIAYHNYQRNPSGWRYLVVTVLLVLGLITKPMLVTWPFLFLLWDFWPARRFTSPVSLGQIRRVVFEKLPWLILAGLASAVTLVAQNERLVQFIPFGVRVINALVSYSRYVGKTFLPRNLAVLYPHPGRNIGVWEITASILTLVSITAAVLLVRKTRPYLAFGWFWYLLTLLPVTGLVQVGQQGMADRYTYVPSIGLCVLIVWGLADATQRHPRARRLLAFVAITIVLPTLAWGTIRQNRYWKDSESLFRHTVEVTENNYLAHNNLGAAYYKKGDLLKAEIHFQRSLQIKPDYAPALFNQGRLLYFRGDTVAAVGYLQRAVQVYPYSADFHLVLAHALNSVRREGEALRHYREALRLDPGHRSARFALASYYLEKDEIGKAAAEYEKLLDESPQDVAALVNLGSARAIQHRYEEAARLLNSAVRLEPANLQAHQNLGKLLEDLGEFDLSAASYAEALRLAPNSTAISQALSRVREAAARKMTKTTDR